MVLPSDKPFLFSSMSGVDGSMDRMLRTFSLQLLINHHHQWEAKYHACHCHPTKYTVDDEKSINMMQCNCSGTSTNAFFCTACLVRVKTKPNNKWVQKSYVMSQCITYHMGDHNLCMAVDLLNRSLLKCMKNRCDLFPYWNWLRTKKWARSWPWLIEWSCISCYVASCVTSLK